MPAFRRTNLWVTGVVGLVAAAGVTALVSHGGKGRRVADSRPAVVIDEKTPLPALAKALRESDARALAVLFQRTATGTEERPAAIAGREATDWVDAIKGMRTGFHKFGSYGRSSALTVAGRVLRRYATDPAPADWIDVLRPVHDLLASGLADANLDVRVTALMEISRCWSWMPGRTPLPAEESLLAEWKQGFVGLVVHHLGDREPKARAAAVACLGHLPIDAAAAPAIAYLNDPSSPDVRKQVLVSFATRANLLSEDAVLKHMYDKEAGIAEVAELVLKTRGLTQEQISLGSMIFHPKPEIRASVIPLLKNRTDVDPTVWLLQLSRDEDEAVRIGAVDAPGPATDPRGEPAAGGDGRHRSLGRRPDRREQVSPGG